MKQDEPKSITLTSHLHPTALHSNTTSCRHMCPDPIVYLNTLLHADAGHHRKITPLPRILVKMYNDDSKEPLSGTVSVGNRPCSCRKVGEHTGRVRALPKRWVTGGASSTTVACTHQQVDPILILPWHIVIEGCTALPVACPRHTPFAKHRVCQMCKQKQEWMQCI